MEKINKLAAVLDKHREVSIQECIYRTLGLPMAKFSVQVKYLNSSHPNKKDRLLRRNIEELGEKDSVFYPSPHQYYENRPEEANESGEGKYKKIWDEMCQADWWSGHTHLPNGKYNKKKNNYKIKN